MKINKQLNINVSTKNFSISEDQDEITLEGYASKMYENGKEVVDLDSEHLSTKSFELLATRLLLNHNLEEPCGHIELEHRPDGIYLKGKAYKDTMSEKEWARLKKGLYSFSVGILAKEAEYKTIDGEDILTFTKAIVFEVSLVGVPSNPKATIENMKSIKQDNQCVGLQCSVEQIKSMNPDMDCSCLADLKKEIKGKEMGKETKEISKKTLQGKIIKGLTIEETMNESWNVDDNLWQMFSYFISTIEENIYEFKWSDSFDKEEMLTNINSAMETFKQTIEVESTRIGETIGKQIDNKGETKDMGKQTKQVETTEVVTEEVTEENKSEVKENKENDSTTESKEEVSSKETQPTEKEPKEDLAKTSEEPTSTEPKETPKTEQPTESTPKEEIPTKVETEEKPKEIEIVKPSMLEIKLEEVSADKIKEAYDSLASIKESIDNKLSEIENYVIAEISKEN